MNKYMEQMYQQARDRLHREPDIVRCPFCDAADDTRKWTRESFGDNFELAYFCAHNSKHGFEVCNSNCTTAGRWTFADYCNPEFVN